MAICTDYIITDKSKYMIDGVVVDKSVVKAQLRQGVCIENLYLADNGQIVFNRVSPSKDFRDYILVTTLLAYIDGNVDIFDIIRTQIKKPDDCTYGYKQEHAILTKIVEAYKIYLKPFNFRKKMFGGVLDCKYLISNVELKGIDSIARHDEFMNKLFNLPIMPDYTAAGGLLYSAFLDDLRSHLLDAFYSPICEFNFDLTNINKTEVIKKYSSFIMGYTKRRLDYVQQHRDKIIQAYKENNGIQLPLNTTTTGDYLDRLKNADASAMKELSGLLATKKENSNESTFIDFVQYACDICAGFEPVGKDIKIYKSARKLYDIATLDLVEKTKDLLGRDVYDNIYRDYSTNVVIYEILLFLYNDNIAIPTIRKTYPYTKKVEKIEKYIIRFNIPKADFAFTDLTFHLLMVLHLDRTSNKYMQLLNSMFILRYDILGVKSWKYYDLGLHPLDTQYDAYFAALKQSWILTYRFIMREVKPEYRENDCVFFNILYDIYTKNYKIKVDEYSYRVFTETLKVPYRPMTIEEKNYILIEK